jgi:hypothetical protein
MKKLTITILSTIVVIFLLAIVSTQVIWRIQDERIFEPCSNLEGEEWSICASEIFADMTVDDCEIFHNEEFRLDCYLHFSKESFDLGICNNVLEENEAQCSINVHTNIAVSQNDSTVCNNLTAGLRFSCVTTVALILKDLNLCEPIGQDSLRYQCKESIVKQIAIDSNDVSICNEFEFQSNKYLESWVPRTRCIERAAFCNMNENLCETSDCVRKVREYRVNSNSLICNLNEVL